MSYKYPFIKPHFPRASELAEDWENIVSSNWYTNFGPYEQRFRHEAAEFIGDDIKACTVSNATQGLEIAVRALLKDPVEFPYVLMPSFTFAAGANALIQNDYTPVFIDINTDIQPDLDQASKFLATHQGSVGGILLCNIFGTGNTEIKEWESLAQTHDLPLIIDSAAGFGSEYQPGERIGARGSCEIFSFHATKPFGIGEGGMITSRDEELIDRCRRYTNFGFGADRQIEFIGTNAKMSEMSAAIGLRQIGGFAHRLAQRRDSLGVYKDGLTKDDGFNFQANDDLSTVAFVSAFSASAERSQNIHKVLQAAGVEARQYYTPLHIQAQIAKHSILAAAELTQTIDIANRAISLPLHDDMCTEAIGHITDLMRSV